VNIGRKLAIAGGITTLAFMGVALPASSAFAAPGPNCPTSNSPVGTGNTDGGTCQVSGSISLSVAEQLAIATDFTSFALTQTDNSAGTAQGAGDVYVMSNDNSGYVVDMASTPYTGSGQTIPAADVSAGDANGNFDALSGVQQFYASGGVSGSNHAAPGTPSGWDGLPQGGFYLNTVPNLPAGTYTLAGTVSYTLWGN
jgi:hypothetical protein